MVFLISLTIQKKIKLQKLYLQVARVCMEKLEKKTEDINRNVNRMAPVLKALKAGKEERIIIKQEKKNRRQSFQQEVLSIEKS